MLAIGQEVRFRHPKNRPMTITAMEGDVVICTWRERDGAVRIADFSAAHLVRRAVKASDISDELMLEAVRQVRGKRGVPQWSMRSDIEDALPQFPHKVVLAKLRSLVKRKLLSGCTCGCRGDFEELPR